MLEDHRQVAQDFPLLKSTSAFTFPVPWVCPDFEEALNMVLTHDPEPVWDKPVEVPEKWIQFVDSNVVASTHLDYNKTEGGHPRSSDIGRITTRIASEGHLTLRHELLDANCQKSNGASGWSLSLLLPQG